MYIEPTKNKRDSFTAIKFTQYVMKIAQWDRSFA